MGCCAVTSPLVNLLAGLNNKRTPILLRSILSALIVTAGCSSIKEYPREWPVQVDIPPSLCPSLVGSYLKAASSREKVNREKVVIAMLSEGVLMFEEHLWNHKIDQKEYSEKEKTLACSSNRAILDEGFKWDAHDGGLASTRREIILSKDTNGVLVMEERRTLALFCLVIPVFKGTENSWSRFAPINHNN